MIIKAFAFVMIIKIKNSNILQCCADKLINLSVLLFNNLRMELIVFAVDIKKNKSQATRKMS